MMKRYELKTICIDERVLGKCGSVFVLQCGAAAEFARVRNLSPEMYERKFWVNVTQEELLQYIDIHPNYSFLIKTELIHEDELKEY